MPVTRYHERRRSELQNKSLRKKSFEDVKAENSEEETPLDEDEEEDTDGEAHIPRPSNCFILYRNSRNLEAKELIAGDTSNAKDVPSSAASKIISKWWNEEPESVKNEWRTRARAVKEEHERMYPDYKYKPKRRVAVDERPPRPRKSRKDPELPTPQRVKNPSTRSRPSATAPAPRERDRSARSHCKVASSMTPPSFDPSYNTIGSTSSSHRNTPSRVSSPIPRISGRRTQYSREADSNPRGFSSFPNANAPYPEALMAAASNGSGMSSAVPPTMLSTDPLASSIFASDVLMYPDSPPTGGPSTSECIPPELEHTYSFEAMAMAHWNALNLSPSPASLSFAQNQAVPSMLAPSSMAPIWPHHADTTTMPPLDTTFSGILNPAYLSTSADDQWSYDGLAPLSESDVTAWLLNGQYLYNAGA